MKTLADFKRRLKVGVLLETESRYGHLGVRPISVVQSNAFALKTINKEGKESDSWCQFPKASDFEIEDENTVLILQNGNPVLRYTFV